MSPGGSSPAESDALAESVDTLTMQVEVLHNAIDDLREVMTWLWDNRRSLDEHQPHTRLLAMSASPSSDTWARVLQLESGVPAIVEQRLRGEYEATIARLQRSIESILQCPELTSANISESTRQTVAEAQSLLSDAILPTAEAPNKPRRPNARETGRLF